MKRYEPGAAFGKPVQRAGAFCGHNPAAGSQTHTFDIAWTPRRIRPELFGACQVRRGQVYGAA